MSEAPTQTAEAMEQVVTVAGDAGQASRAVLEGSTNIGREADTLRNEVDQFLVAVREDPTEQRHYERLSGNGASVSVQAAGHPAARVALRNISRGGASLACDWPLAQGSELRVELPAGGGMVTARVARSGDGELAVVFSSEREALVAIDRMLATWPPTRQAA